MGLTADALWLNLTFEGYDSAILGLAHKAAEVLGNVLTPLNKVITLLGEKGILFFLLALVFMLIPRFRKTGVCIFGAVCCGALITNIILKDYVARPRPFETVEVYRQWWEFVGAPAEEGFSFPSGHVTAAAAGVTSICLMRGKRWFIPGAIWVLLMMFSRNYLMAHYPSDVLFAMLIGIFSGFVAAGITALIFRILENHSDSVFCSFLLEAGIGGKSHDRSSARAERKPKKAKKEARAAHHTEEAKEEDSVKKTAPQPHRETGSSHGEYVPRH